MILNQIQNEAHAIQEILNFFLFWCRQTSKTCLFYCLSTPKEPLRFCIVCLKDSVTQRNKVSVAQFCTANQMFLFYMKCNIGLKCLKRTPYEVIFKKGWTPSKQASTRSKCIVHVVDYEHVVFRDVAELNLQDSSRSKLFYEKLVWRICQMSQENACDEVFLVNLQL